VKADFDHNGYLRSDPTGQFLRVAMRSRDGKEYVGACDSLQEFRDRLGMEEHGVEMTWHDFRAPPPPGEEPNADTFDATLNPEGKAVDAGRPLPNINDGFAGKAPDLGCYEVGRPMPHYGPRHWDTTESPERGADP
jgi:hypothetical protein